MKGGAAPLVPGGLFEVFDQDLLKVGGEEAPELAEVLTADVLGIEAEYCVCDYLEVDLYLIQ